MIKRKFYHCAHCGNIFGAIEDKGVVPICCGEKMRVLEPNTTDAAQEKHVPVATRDGAAVTVKVGSAPHPMEAAHHIQWIMLAQEGFTQRAHLEPGAAPEAKFTLAFPGKPFTAYEYCNLHGLWAADGA